MKSILKTFVAMILVLALMLTGPCSAMVLAAESAVAEIRSADMSLESAKSNVQEYYSNEDWTEVYPEGLFLMEYSSYELTEGGTDPEHPEDVYLEITVYRIGGNSNGATVQYMVNCTLGDSQMYPDSMGEVTFAPGETKASIYVKVKNDDVYEGNQLLAVSLTEATTGMISVSSTAMVKIFDDDPYVDSVIHLSVPSVTTDAADGHVSVTLRRSGNTVDVSSLRVKTENGTAKAGKHYESVEQEVIFLNGQVEQTVTVPLIQSEDAYTQAKSLTLYIEDLKGCISDGNDHIRLDITNRKDEPAKLLTPVDETKADVELDDAVSLSDSSTSVVNVNDDVDRTALLRTIIGAGNGTSVQQGNTALFAASSGSWSDTVTVPASEFEQRYASDGQWKAGSVFTNGNEDLLLTSKKAYDLNQFKSMTFCLSNENGSAIMGNPNTAMGYLVAGGASDHNEKFSFVKSDLRYSTADHAWMKQKQMYFLVNRNNSNIDWITNPTNINLYDGAQRYLGAGGLEGSNSKLFIMSYDDEGWDDTHLDVREITLKRAAIPFSLFSKLGDEDSTVTYNDPSKSNELIVFYKDHYRWSISIDQANGGGVVQIGADSDPVEKKYGFYVGSNLIFRYTAQVEGASLPEPEYLYLCDDDGSIHNACKVSADGTFRLPLQTIMSNNTSVLKDRYYMTDAQARDHINNTLGADQCIGSTFSEMFEITASYVLRQGTSLSFANVPTLAKPMTLADGSIESAEDQENRIYDALYDVVTFYANNTTVHPDYQIDLKNNTIVYDAAEFDKMRIDPKAEDGYRVSSNLYDLDYQIFDQVTTVPYEVFSQVSGNVMLNIYDADATYLEPQLSASDTSVSVKNGDDFETVYVLNDLEDYITFEALYSDTDPSPKVQYYTVRFTISDIYAPGMSGEVKKYNVNVNHVDSMTQETYKLFSFTYKGGASFAEASDVELRDLNSKFKTNEGTGYESYLPVLELVDSASGYEYVLRIPTYYNHQYPNGGDPMEQYYNQIFRGSDGIRFEMHNYDPDPNAQDAELPENEIVAALDYAQLKSVTAAIPNVVTSSPEQTVESPYFEEQNEYYTYNDHQVSMAGFMVKADCTGLGTMVSKFAKLADNKSAAKWASRFSGSGLYVQAGNEQIVFGFRLVGNAYSSDFKSDDGSMPVTNGGKPRSASYQLNKTFAPYIFGSFDASVTMTYNRLTHRYDFSAISVMVNGGAGLTATFPIPPAPVLYATFSVKGSVSIATGCSFVQEYIDQNGKIHYNTSFNGITIGLAVSGSAGLGVGYPGLLAFEGSFNVDTSLSVRLGSDVYVPAQREFDLDSTLKDDQHPAYTATFSPNWKTYKAKDEGYSHVDNGDKDPQTVYYNCYKNTLLRSETAGDLVTFVTNAASFQLIGAKEKTGGVMRVTVTNVAANEVLATKDVDLYADQTELYRTLFSWELPDFDHNKTQPINVKITIENISNRADGESGGTRISLDSMRLHNLTTAGETGEFASMESFSLRMALTLKLCVLGFNFSLEPGYMLIKASNTSKDTDDYLTASLTLGSFYHSKTFEATWDPEAKNARMSDLPILRADSRTGTFGDPDYFDTGEFASAKTKELLKADIDNTAKTQVIEQGGDIYSFYTVLDTDAEGGASYYQLYYAKNDVSMGLVCESVYVSDFHAYIDGNGRLAVMMSAADSTVQSIQRNDDGSATLNVTDGQPIHLQDSDDLGEALNRTCIQTVTLGNDGRFGQPVTLTGTDAGGVQESLPVATSTRDLKRDSDKVSGVAFFVEDTLTDVQAEYDLNWTAFNDKTAGTSEMMTDLFNSMYKGKSQVRYAVMTADGYSAVQTLPMDERLVTAGYEKAGYKITGIDAIMADDDTVVLAYSIELPYAVKGGFTGVLKEIHYRKGTIQNDGTVTFGEVVVADSLFDYDDDLADVFPDGNLPDRYYDEISGSYHDNIILSQVQLENVALCENGEYVEDADIQPCLFYRTNSSINYITADELDAKGEAGVLYDRSFDAYVISVGEDGNIYLIYNDITTTSDYTDTLYIMDYNSEDAIWNKPRRLTYTDAFDEEAYTDREPTASVIFDDFSALVDRDGKVAVALKSSYVPFSYDYLADAKSLNTVENEINDLYDRVYVDEDGNVMEGISVPVLDYESDYARTDIFMITFADRVTAVSAENFELSSTRFLSGQPIEAAIKIDNVGDYMINGMNVSLCYYNLSTGARDSLVTKRLTGTLLAGDDYEMILDYTVGDQIIPDNTLLTVRITDLRGRLLYDSYEDCYLPYQAGEWNDAADDDGYDGDENDDLVFYEINNHAEISYGGMDVDVDSEGIMTYRVNVANCGTLDAASDATLYFDTYTYNEETMEYSYADSLFSVTIPAERLTAGGSTLITDQYPVKDHLAKTPDGYSELYYRFKLITNDPQYDVTDDTTEVQICQQIPEVEVENIRYASGGKVNTDGRIVTNLKLGDEIVVDNKILSEYITNDRIRAYELGSNCLSIDASATDGTVRIKAIGLPENNEGYVTLLIHIRDTVIYRYLYLYISNTDTMDLTDDANTGDWTNTGRDHVYATEYDLLQTEKDGSVLTFGFVGEDLRLYGDLLQQGGDFDVAITDAAGKTVLTDTVSTKMQKNNYGMLLYRSEKLPFGSYTVTLTARLDEDEMLSLDHARFTIDTSGADTTPYAVVERSDKKLDAPLLSGRQRQAQFKLNFNKAVELAEGKTLADLTVQFAEYESADGTFTPTGETVTFTASEIRDHTVIFTADLTSKQGSVMKYVLADAYIPADVLVTAGSGRPVKTAIPSYGTVSYTLRESGILSATVAEDTEMPDGSVQRSVKVKFMREPDTNRLLGTKLLYTTTDENGAEQSVAFEYAGLTMDPRVAIYRAEKLELSAKEMRKTFAFEEGIVLSESQYVLVTAEGDYLENDVSAVLEDASQLDITYDKLRSENRPEIGWTATVGGYIPTVTVTYEEAVRFADAMENAYLLLDETVDGTTTQRKLTLQAAQAGTLTFRAQAAVTYPADATVTYSLHTHTILYTDPAHPILREYDGIAVDPGLKAAQPMTIYMGAHIQAADLYFKDGAKATGTTLCADVRFDGTVQTDSLQGTTLTVCETATRYSGNVSAELILTLDSVQHLTDENGAYTLATYLYSEDVSLTDKETAKRFTVSGALTLPENAQITDTDGKVYSADIPERNMLTLARTTAENATLQMVEGSDGVYVEMTVTYPEKLSVSNMDQITAPVCVETDGVEQTLLLKLISCDDGTLTFRSADPIIRTSGTVTAITGMGQLDDPYGSIVTENGIAVSQTIPAAECVLDLTGKGVVTTADLTVKPGGQGQMTLQAVIGFDVPLSEVTFRKSTLPVSMYIEYADGQIAMVEQTLSYESLSDGQTAVYTANVTVPADAALVQFTLGEVITTFGNNWLYSEDETLRLSTDLPAAPIQSLQQMTPDVVAILTKLEDGTIESLNDTFISVTYPEAITVRGMDGITLSVKVSGIEGVETVTYKADQIYNGETLVFVPASDVDGRYANAVELSLTGAKLTLADGSGIFDKQGLPVSSGLPDGAQTFLLAGGDVPVVPGPDPSDTPSTPDVSTQPDVSTTSSEKPETSTATSAPAGENGTSPETGDSGIGFMLMVAVLGGLAALVTVLWKKRT